jgi:hypothetical protein
MYASNDSTFNLWFVLDKEKLNGANFIDWYRNLRIVLRQEKIEYVLQEPYPDDLHDDASIQLTELMRRNAMMHSM